MEIIQIPPRRTRTKYLDLTDPAKENVCVQEVGRTDPTQKTLSRSRRPYRSHRKTENNLDLADHTDPTPDNINMCANDRSFRSHLGKRVWTRARSCRMHPGKRIPTSTCVQGRVLHRCSLHKGTHNTYMRGKNNSIISTPGSAEEPPCCPLPRSSAAAEPLQLCCPRHLPCLLR